MQFSYKWRLRKSERGETLDFSPQRLSAYYRLLRCFPFPCSLPLQCFASYHQYLLMGPSARLSDMYSGSSQGERSNGRSNGPPANVASSTKLNLYRGVPAPIDLELKKVLSSLSGSSMGRGSVVHLQTILWPTPFRGCWLLSSCSRKGSQVDPRCRP